MVVNNTVISGPEYLTMETKNCPECTSEIPKEARVCPFCGERIEGIRCQECQSFSPDGARKCRCCGARLGIPTAPKLEAFDVQASFAGTLLTRLNFFPQRAFFTPEKITIRTYGFLGVTSNDEEILWEKVAGFAHRNGIFWDTISIETRGQTPASIACLEKADSDKVRQVLQGLER